MDDHITRVEYDDRWAMFLRGQNGSLRRIEKDLEEIKKGLSDQHSREHKCREEVDAAIANAVEGKVSYSLMMLVTALSSTVVGLAVALVTRIA